VNTTILTRIYFWNHEMRFLWSEVIWSLWYMASQHSYTTILPKTFPNQLLEPIILATPTKLWVAMFLYKTPYCYINMKGSYYNLW
jgi:hypothetical protein